MLGLYGTDGSNYRVVPDLVVVPADVDDLVTAALLTSRAGAPIVVRGAGTSMAGNAIGGVVIDVSHHLDAILDIDPVRRIAVVEPGVVLTYLNGAAAASGLTFGVDPSSASRATLGGMIANNACGAHSVAWGTTADNLRGLVVLLSGGTRMELTTPTPYAPFDRFDTLRAAVAGSRGSWSRSTPRWSTACPNRCAGPRLPRDYRPAAPGSWSRWRASIPMMRCAPPEPSSPTSTGRTRRHVLTGGRPAGPGGAVALPPGQCRTRDPA